MERILSELELETKKYMMETGDTRKETAEHFGITETELRKRITVLKRNGLWNEKEYEKAKTRKRVRETRKDRVPKSFAQTEAYKYIRDILAIKYLDYDPADPQTFDTTIPQQLSKLNKEYSDTVILRALKLSEKSINYTCHHKNFATHRNKVMYIFAIIKNNIKRAVEEETLAQQVQLRQEQNTKVEEVKDIDESNIEKRRDLSSLIDEDDM